ncbi:MAG TPA: AbrB family transcriptional regulator [Stellaceae bacterium]|nr:AbrB family transcriptional regulator [Stellaceae bacterium]
MIGMRISKWGSYLAVKLPRKLVRKLGLRAGDQLDIVAASFGEIMVEKIDPQADFLKRMERFHWHARPRCTFNRDEANERRGQRTGPERAGEKA